MLWEGSYLLSMSDFVRLIIIDHTLYRLFMSASICVPSIDNLQGLYVSDIQWFYLDSLDI